jgi:hypothetical protein
MGRVGAAEGTEGMAFEWGGSRVGLNFVPGNQTFLDIAEKVETKHKMIDPIIAKNLTSIAAQDFCTPNKRFEEPRLPRVHPDKSHEIDPLLSERCVSVLVGRSNIQDWSRNQYTRCGTNSIRSTQVDSTAGASCSPLKELRKTIQPDCREEGQ